ncbi:MAG TPA: hypothetical protein VGF69_07575 [Thermoanaerobaculia bacterium]
MRHGKHERGAALISVIFAASLVLLLLMIALTLTRLSGRTLARQLTYQGQAINAASAGLNESLSWFIRQQPQPVVAFNPQIDPGGVCPHVPPHLPPVTDSEDPAAGIVRSYEIMGTGRVFGRYAIRRTAVTDVSTRRGKVAAGTIWRIASEGTIYVRNDAAKQPNEAPNIVLSSATMAAELQRMGIQLPGPNAALAGLRGSSIQVQNAGRVRGGSAGLGITYPPATGTPTMNGIVSGTPGPHGPTNGSFALQNVFGVTQQELIAMADLVVDDERQLPEKLPTMSLIVVRGNATFNPTRKLVGSGILVILGNLTLNPGSDTFYSGIVYVTGNLVISPPSVVNGAVVGLGKIQLTGGSEVSEINYDAAMIDQIRLQLGNYRFSRSAWVVGRDGR